MVFTAPHGINFMVKSGINSPFFTFFSFPNASSRRLKWRFSVAEVALYSI